MFRHAAFISRHALERSLNHRLSNGILVRVPVEKPRVRIVRARLFGVAKAVAVEVGVVVDVVDVLVTGEVIDGAFEGGVEGESEGVHRFAPFEGEILRREGIPFGFECYGVALGCLLVEELGVACGQIDQQIYALLCVIVHKIRFFLVFAFIGN